MSFENPDQALPIAGHMDLVRSTADQRAQLAYEANPELHAYAAERAAGLAEEVRAMFDEVEGPVEPAESRLRSGYTKLIFTFTRPEDYTDTLDYERIIDETAQLLRMPSEEEEPDLVSVLQALGLSVDNHASHMFLLAEQPRIGGRLNGLNASEQLDFTLRFLEAVLTPDPEQESGFDL